MLELYIRSRSNVICTCVAFLAVMTASCFASEQQSALKRYVQSPAPAFSWEVRKNRDEGDIRMYDLLLVSQEWKTGRWSHQLRVMVPQEKRQCDTCLLFISGGHNRDGHPAWLNRGTSVQRLLRDVVSRCRIPVTVLRQVPNQPLLGGLTEDELIAETLMRYLKTRDARWPLLLPMVKSAVQAMDAVQAFGEEHLSTSVSDFVVAGASKRGWTTWLTAAHDPRVTGIAPMVIDILNMPAQMDHQRAVWGDYSRRIAPYTRKIGGESLLELVQDPRGKPLVSLVDPYVYRDRITVPKLIFIGTNDPYWPIDAAGIYYHGLTGPSFLHYVPNAGHGLGDGRRAANALAAFVRTISTGVQHPELCWTTERDSDGLSIRAKASEAVADATLWTARSPNRDFRQAQFQREECQVSDTRITASISRSRESFKAGFVDVAFDGPAGEEFRQSTECFVIKPTEE